MLCNRNLIIQVYYIPCNNRYRLLYVFVFVLFSFFNIFLFFYFANSSRTAFDNSVDVGSNVEINIIFRMFAFNSSFLLSFYSSLSAFSIIYGCQVWTQSPYKFHTFPIHASRIYLFYLKMVSYGHERLLTTFG